MTEQEQLQQAIALQEQMRGIAPDGVIDAAVTALKNRLAELEAAAAESQRKQVAILFADVSGFTALSETMDAEDAQTFINQLWEGVDEAIHRYNGHIDKHIGDAVMALWGVNQAQEDDAERAIRAALAMQTAVAAFSAAQNIPLTMRVGVNYGPVILGYVGSGREFTAMGDAVNVAARLESASPLGGVLISHDAYRQARGLFDLIPQPPLTVKGKTESLQTYVVVRARAHAFRQGNRGVEGLETVMIGRAAELEQLQAGLQTAARERQNWLAMITGDAGLGKSRLLYEFDGWLDKEAEFPAVVFKGRTDLQRQTIPFALLRDLFYFRFQILDSDNPTNALGKLETGCAAFMGEDGREAAHFIAHLIGLNMSDSPIVGGILQDARQVRSRAFQQVVAFFTAVAARSPIVIFLEDMHWADVSSLELFNYMGRECAGLPLFLLGSARPSLYERRSNWGEAWKRKFRLDLRPLSDAESRQLIAHILRKIPDLPAALVETIDKNAEGNPFYVEELIKMLIDQGTIVANAAAWWVATDELTGLRIPPTLAGILQARLDRLSKEERGAMQRAAVMGRIFWDMAVAYLAELRQEETIRAEAERIANLQAKGLVLQRPDSAIDGATEYIMKHAILREVTYETTLKKHRAVYHRRAAEWLSNQSQAEAFAGLIAEHYRQAGDLTQMANWYVNAGKQAMLTYSYDEATNYLQAAVDNPDVPIGSKFNAYLSLSHLAGFQGKTKEVSDYADQALQIAEETNNSQQKVQAWQRKSGISYSLGRLRQALEEISEAEAQLLQSPAYDAATHASLLDDKGWIYLWLSDVNAARLAGEKSLQLATENQFLDGLGRVRNLMGAVWYMQSDYHAAMREWEQARDFNRQIGKLYTMAQIINNMGECAAKLGDYEQALAYYLEALSLFEKIRLPGYTLICRVNIAALRREQGYIEEAVATLRQVFAEAPAVWSFRPLACYTLAETLLWQGQTAESLALTQEAWRLATQNEAVEDTGHAWRMFGLIAAAGQSVAPDPDNPDDQFNMAACFAKSVEIFTSSGMVSAQATTLWQWGRAERDYGSRKKGRELWQEARQLFERLDLPLWTARLDEERYSYA